MVQAQGKHRRALLIALACVLLAGSGAWLWTRYAPKKTAGATRPVQATVPVVTGTAAAERMPIYLTGIGTVTPLYSVLVKVRVDGQLQKVAFTEGQYVKAGDLLAQIDARPFQAQLAQFVAQKARDDAQLKNSILDLERYSTLLQQDSVARQQVDTQRAAVDQLKATLQLDQAQIDSARVQLDYTTIRAPISGRTGARLSDPGNIVRASDNTGIVMINQIDPISVLFTLPEDKFQSLRPALAASGGKSLAIQAYARANGELLGTGKLTLINNQIDTATGTFQAKAIFANQASALWPGQYVNVRVIMDVLEHATTIPESAVQRGPQGLYVYVVKPDTSVAMQAVDLKQIQDGKAIVNRGIEPGARIVVDGQYKLKPGVKIVEAPTSERQNPPAAAKQASSGGAKSGAR